MIRRVSLMAWTGIGGLALAALSGCGGGGDDSAATQGPFAATVDCTSLAKAQLPNTTIVSAQQIPAGTYQPPGSATAFTNLPSFCRVVATVSPVPDSQIGVEVWLPTSTWNGKYEQVGTHAFAGTYYWNEMAPPLRRGYATAATNDGHTNAGGFDVSWAFGHPQKVVDVAWRGIHETSAKAKLLISQYYSRAQKYAYYFGCSNGGRGGMKAAQVLPDDFDGIVAGGAAQWWTGTALQQLAYTKNAMAAGITGNATTSVLNLTQAATIAACDSLDGVTDGIIGDPRKCTSFNPQSLVCVAGQDPATCLTADQANAIVSNTSPVSYTNGKFVAYGMTVGSEFDQLRFNFPGQDAYAVSNISLGLNNAAWDKTTFDLNRDGPIVELTLNDINAIDPNLTPFKTAGAKLIQYHGWGDAAFPAPGITRYYDDVVAATGNGDLKSVQDFYRLFMVPSSGHCLNSGPGPDNIGGENQAAVSVDPQHDLLSALENWVEKGVAPDKIIASRQTDRTNTNAASPVLMQRPICAYPAQAIYKGSGDTNVESSFTCQAP